MTVSLLSSQPQLLKVTQLCWHGDIISLRGSSKMDWYLQSLGDVTGSRVANISVTKVWFVLVPVNTTKWRKQGELFALVYSPFARASVISLRPARLKVPDLLPLCYTLLLKNLPTLTKVM